MFHQKIFVPYILLFAAHLSLFHTETLFSLLKYIVYKCYSYFRQRRGHFFFHRHTCIQWLHSFSLYNALYTLVTHFCGSSENICPIYWLYSLVHSSSQSVSHWNSVFSFKILCLQMLQLFQTKKGSFFFIVTLLYSGYIAFPYIMHCIHLSHFFMLHQKTFVLYILLCTACLSLFHTQTLFSPLKYIVYKCYSCFRQRRGHFFTSSHLFTVVT